MTRKKRCSIALQHGSKTMLQGKRSNPKAERRAGHASRNGRVIQADRGGHKKKQWR